MSEEFDAYLAQRAASQKSSGSTQRLILIGLGVAFVLVFVFVVLRGDPNTRPVNPNTASASQLATLPEVGPVTAQAIIQKRAEMSFSKPEDLLKVKGIGKVRLEQMRPRLKFD
ncbi:MAG: competence protein ComEA-like protein with helix-hairpin-helix repeat region [Verrucomicrobiaceae bacterium]|nr:competence protein ComEA-like protein with helix-hairpin-helix repeat region [Verrucomicrobiaceae bacterium]